MKRFCLILTLFTLVLTYATANTWVKVAKDVDNGWLLLVDGKPMAVHGMVWSFVPIGHNYSYSLWDQPEEIIQKMIDTDAVLMQEMGVNAIRVFADVPPKWISYLYSRYGIYTVVNDLFGRYGMMVDGRWHARTNYADMRTRELILEQLEENVSRYKGVDGVLFYLLGNENNYGLEWDSNVIENLPVGQRLEIRAGYLYSLFEEGIQIVKNIDPTKPVGIVNGDIQYLNIINELTPSLDILGVNTYRGRAAHDLFYESVAETLDVPIVYTEFGADAYNVVEEKEDQYNQAEFIRSQWEEIYHQSYGKGGFQNILGGFVFAWMDEWWKSPVTGLGLDDHDTNATWSNGSYEYDSGTVENNMNEEWWGIVAQSPYKVDGIYQRRPRAAYFALQEIWKLDQLNCTKEEIDNHFDFNLRILSNHAELIALQQKEKEDGKIDFRGKVNFVAAGSFDNIDVANDAGLENMNSSVGEWAYLGVDMALRHNIDAGLTVRLQGHIPDTAFEKEEYSRFVPNELLKGSFVDKSVFSSNETGLNVLSTQPVELYDAYLNWDTDLADIDLYYHNGHIDWKIEGDYFHLLPESFDYIGMDLAGSQAPFGLQITGKEFLEGLTLYGGPEIYWGATPQIMAKYYRPGEHFSWSLMYREAFATNKTETGIPDGRKASGWMGLNFYPWITADFGVLFAGSQFLDESYNHVARKSDDTYSISNEKINMLDTLSFKVDLATELFLYTKIFARYIYAGRVSSSNAYSTRDGSQISDIGTGNRYELEVGFRFQYDWFTLMPKFLARVPITHPQSAYGNLSPVAVRSSPVSVFKNRETLQMEVILGFDPAGDTYFFDWNNEERENATIAGYVSFLYSFMEGETDRSYFKNEFGSYYDFDGGLPEVKGAWSLKGRLVWNMFPKVRLNAGFQAGSGQSLGDSTRLVNYWGADINLRLASWMIKTSMDFDAWGDADWMRQLNITYPLQWTLDVSYGFDIPSFLDSQNRIGMRWKGRTYDEYSADTANGADWKMELLAYLSFSW